MPIYDYECEACGVWGDAFRAMDERHNAPACPDCKARMKLRISACAGVVKFPAAGGHEYVSTTTGKYITTERARRDDLKRSGCRQYEGFEQEKKEADRKRAYEEQESDAKLEEAARRAYYQLSPSKRRVLDAA
ncbi:MAG TPA: FmdB family zinc ribbon protein [Steroidobacteraceae bacterium]|nr:FmdB family zinc ribbon protein [Steroidobacteraceae bacterium]